MSKAALILVCVVVVAIAAFAASYFGDRLGDNHSAKAGIAALFAVLAFVGGKMVSPLEKRVSAPSVVIRTEAGTDTLSLNVLTDDESMDALTVSFHLPAHVKDVRFPGTAFQGKIEALVTGGDDPGALSNRVDVTFDKLEPNQLRTALLTYTPQPGVRLPDQDRYEVLYSWWFNGERITERVFGLLNSDRRTRDPGMRNNVTRVVKAEGTSWGVLTGTDFYKVRGREPNLEVDLITDDVKLPDGSIRTRAGINRRKKGAPKETSETVWSVEWTDSPSGRAERIAHATITEPQPRLFTNRR